MYIHAHAHDHPAVHALMYTAHRHLDVQRGGLEGREAPPPHRQHELHQEAVLIPQGLPQLVLQMIQQFDENNPAHRLLSRSVQSSARRA